MPGCEKSAPKAARPVTLSAPSGRGVRLPIHLLLEPFAVMSALSIPFRRLSKLTTSATEERLPISKAKLIRGWHRATLPLSYKEAAFGQLPNTPRRYVSTWHTYRCLGTPPLPLHGADGRATAILRGGNFVKGFGYRPF